MAALGELLVLLVYFVLSIPTLITILIVIFSKAKEKRKKRLILAAILSIPFAAFCCLQHFGFKQMELENAGTYTLNEYPNCTRCLLILDSNNTYTVHDNGKVLRTGKWKLHVGGDYYIVNLDDEYQLGGGGLFSSAKRISKSN